MTRFSRRSLLAGAGALPILRSGRVAMAQTESPITPIEPSETPTDNGTVTVSGRYFGDTGHNLKAPFLRAWQAAGGREGIGAPISEERFQEGVGVTQSFQAVSLVFDPGLEAPWDIQATHISDDVRRADCAGHCPEPGQWRDQQREIFPGDRAFAGRQVPEILERAR